MASTLAGRRWTDSYRRRQVRIAAGADSAIRRSMTLLDPSDIAGSRLLWQERMVQVVQRFHDLSESDAIQYLSRYRLAETGSLAGPVVTPGLDVAATRGVLDAAGPQGFMRRVGQGVPDLAAFQRAANEVAAEARKIIMAGGRGVVRESARGDQRAYGWRRVTDGDPCTFCAMLASRGPAYTSLATALAKGNGDPYHAHCGCTVEALYDDWKPTELEQQFIDVYETAAEGADAVDQPRVAETVLWRMREQGNFGDSPARRRVTK